MNKYITLLIIGIVVLSIGVVYLYFTKTNSSSTSYTQFMIQNTSKNLTFSNGSFHTNALTIPSNSGSAVFQIINTDPTDLTVLIDYSSGKITKKYEYSVRAQNRKTVYLEKGKYYLSAESNPDTVTIIIK